MTLLVSTFFYHLNSPLFIFLFLFGFMVYMVFYFVLCSSPLLLIQSLSFPFPLLTSTSHQILPLYSFPAILILHSRMTSLLSPSHYFFMSFRFVFFNHLALKPLIFPSDSSFSHFMLTVLKKKRKKIPRVLFILCEIILN